MVQNQSDQQEPRVEPQLLSPNLEIIRLRHLEVLPAKNRLVEDVRLQQKPGLAGPHVLAEIQLANPAGDLTNLPPLQAGLDELLPVLLLELPEPHVGLERLVEQVALGGASFVRREVADAGILLVRGLHQSAEGPPSRVVAVLRHAAGKSKLNTAPRSLAQLRLAQIENGK